MKISGLDRLNKPSTQKLVQSLPVGQMFEQNGIVYIKNPTYMTNLRTGKVRYYTCHDICVPLNPGDTVTLTQE